MYRPPEGNEPADKREICATCRHRLSEYYVLTWEEAVMLEGYPCPVIADIVPANYVCSEWARRLFP